MASPENPSTTRARRTAPKKAGVGLSASTGKSASTRSSKTAKTNDGQSSASQRVVSPEERYRMTEVAAYFIAEHNNFDGNPTEYWQAAESQINRMLEQR